MPDLPASTVRLRRLGLHLRRLREAAGLTLEEAGTRMERSLSSLSKIENGRVRVPPRDLRVILDAYAVEDERLRESLITLARDSRKRGWWQQYGDVLDPAGQDFMSLEADAYSVRAFETILIPGLLQTVDYARALHLATPGAGGQEDIERFLRVRSARQEVLTRPVPVRLWTIIGEAALRARIGGADTMKTQLGHLLASSELENVTIQIVPFTVGAHAGVNGPFVILEFPDLSDWDVISVGTLGGTLYLEDEPSIRRFSTVFDHLRASALSEEDSVTLIQQVIEELS